MSVRDAFDRYVAVWAKLGEDDDAGAVHDELKALVADDVVYVGECNG